LSGGNTAKHQILQAFCFPIDHYSIIYGDFSIFKQKKQISSLPDCFRKYLWKKHHRCIINTQWTGQNPCCFFFLKTSPGNAAKVIAMPCLPDPCLALKLH
jgi:hypothetical protein